MPQKNFVHVTPRKDGNWNVKREGATRASSVQKTQADAIKQAETIAKREHGELLIHGENNLIRERNSYGHDPYPPEG